MLRALATLALCAALVGCQSVATYFGGDAAPGGSPLYDAGADDAGDATRPDGPDIPDGPPTPDGPLDAQLPRGPCAPAEIFRQSLNEESFDLSLDSLGQPHVVYLSDLLIASGIYHGVGTSSSWNTADIGLSLTLTRLAGIVDGTDRLHLLYGAASSGPVYRVRDATSAAWSVVDTLDDQLIRTDSVSLTTDTTTGTVYGAVSGRSLFESAIQRFSLEAKSSVPFI